MATSVGPLHDCQCGGMFSRCRQPAVDICQYCGREFCEAHTYYAEDHHAVCTNKRCQRKHDDLEVHEEYKRGVRRDNIHEHCGEPECREAPHFTCSLCRGLFCGPHLTERKWSFRDAQASFERVVSICEHCWGRRKIWQ